MTGERHVCVLLFVAISLVQLWSSRKPRMHATLLRQAGVICSLEVHQAGVKPQRRLPQPWVSASPSTIRCCTLVSVRLFQPPSACVLLVLAPVPALSNRLLCPVPCCSLGVLQASAWPGGAS